MESYSIPILESLPIVSIMMPYYGFSHETFILLSAVWTNSRHNLINHYWEFRRYMLQYAKKMKYKIRDLYKMMLPLDLFIFLIDESSLDKGINDLIALVDTIIWDYYI